jgi:hypothetical protein
MPVLQLNGQTLQLNGQDLFLNDPSIVVEAGDLELSGADTTVLHWDRLRQVRFRYRKL